MKYKCVVKWISVVLLLSVFISMFNINIIAFDSSLNKISSELYNELKNVNDNDSTFTNAMIVGEVLDLNPVASKVVSEDIFAKIYKPVVLLDVSKPSLMQIQENIKSSREKISSLYYEYNCRLVAELGIENNVEYMSKYAPVIFATISKADVYNVAKSDKIIAIEYSPSIDESVLDLEQYLDISRSSIRASTVQTFPAYQYTGEGIKIGILETYEPYLGFEWLQGANVELYSSNTDYMDSSYGGHATSILSILASQGSENTAVGIAPDALYYCSPIMPYLENANSLPSAYVAALDWLMEKNVNIINISTGIGNIFNSYTTTAISGAYYLTWLIDYYSSTSNVCFVMASGNSGSTGVGFPCMAYNAITVGNIDDNNTVSVTDDSLYEKSSYYNSINPIYSSKPDICAPGTLISINGSNQTYMGSNLVYDGIDAYVDTTGTSVAAPQVVGAIALLCEQEQMLLYSLMAVKAILMTGVNTLNHIYVPCDRVVTTDATAPANSYIQYGAGILNCLNSTVIVDNGTFDFGYYASTTSSSSDYLELNAGQNVRVALSYELYTDDYNTTIDNFDVYLYDSNGVLIDSSTTTYNTVEIIDAYISESGTYTLKTVRTSSNNADIYMGLAWTQY